MRILLVEDSERLQRAIEFHLRKAGYAVDVTGDGTEGLWQAENNDYDAIVLDWMLPGMDGVSVVRHLRAAGRQSPVLLLTVQSEVASASKDCGRGQMITCASRLHLRNCWRG